MQIIGAVFSSVLPFGVNMENNMDHVHKPSWRSTRRSMVYRFSCLWLLFLVGVSSIGFAPRLSYAGVPTTVVCPTPTPAPPVDISDTEPKNVFETGLDYAHRLAYLIAAYTYSKTQILSELIPLVGEEIISFIIGLAVMLVAFLVIFALGAAITAVGTAVGSPAGGAAAAAAFTAGATALLKWLGLAWMIDSIVAKAEEAAALFAAGAREAWFSDGDTPTILSGGQKMAKAQAILIVAIGLSLVAYAGANPGKLRGLLGPLEAKIGKGGADDLAAAAEAAARKDKPCCFATGTPVQVVADGTTKQVPIESVKVGDFVPSKDAETGVSMYAPLNTPAADNEATSGAASRGFEPTAIRVNPEATIGSRTFGTREMKRPTMKEILSKPELPHKKYGRCTLNALATK